MSHKTLLFLFFLISHSFFAKAQSEVVRQGYIINLSGDTLRGTIRESTDYNNSHAVDFKGEKDSQIITYQPAQLKAYVVDDEKFYQSKEVKMTATGEKLFLREVIKSATNLYHLKDQYNNNLYFIEKSNGEVLFLKAQYVSAMLNTYLSDCPSMTGQERYSYTLASLSEAIVKYNQCKNPEEKVLVRMQPERLIIRGGARLGANAGTFSYPTEGASYYGLSFTPGIGITGGFFLNFTYGKRLSFQSELLIISKNTSVNDTRNTASGVPAKKVNFKVTYLQVPLYFKYTFGKAVNKPYMLLGISASYALYRNNKLLMDAFAFGGLTGAGITFSGHSKRQISLELRLEESFTNIHRSSNGILQSTLHFTTSMSF